MWDQVAYLRKRKNEHRAKGIKYLGGKCINCGATEQLEFDHIKRSSKAHQISWILGCSWDMLKIELDKCQLLCKPCHIKKSIIEIDLVESTHGMLSMYTNKNCRCSLCVAANTLYFRQYRLQNKLEKVIL